MRENNFNIGEKLNELALFAGAGGGILGGKLLGWRTICAVEINPYARRVLLSRQADGCLDRFPIWDDITTFDGRCWKGTVDVVSGGFPCQDISCAGSKIGIDGERSGLWSEMARIISEVQPKYVFVENSPMLLVRGINRVLGDLAALGYDARWGVIGAKNAGGPIHRDRLWILAGTGKKSSRRIYRWPYKIKRDMVNDIQTRSFIDCYLEELETQGGQREDQRKSDVPPYLLRVDNGMAPELDEIRCIGNGQVPVVVAKAFETLNQNMV